MAGTVLGEMLGRVTIPVRSVPAGTTGDTPVTIPFASYIVRGLLATNASTSLAGTTATISLRTASAGGGNAIVNAAALTTLTAATVLVDTTLSIATTTQTSGTLYVRIVQGVSPVVGTIDVAVEVQPLP